MVKPKVQNPVIEWRSGWRKKHGWHDETVQNPIRNHDWNDEFQQESIFSRKKMIMVEFGWKSFNTNWRSHLKLVGNPIRNPPFVQSPPKKKNPGCCYPLSRTNPYPYPKGNLGKSSSTQTCRLLNMIQKGPGGWQHNPKSPVKLMFTHNLKREKNIPALKLTAKLPENGCLEDDELSFWSEGSQTWSWMLFYMSLQYHYLHRLRCSSFLFGNHGQCNAVLHSKPAGVL